jgi:hypothetical protein
MLQPSDQLQGEHKYGQKTKRERGAKSGPKRTKKENKAQN